MTRKISRKILLGILFVSLYSFRGMATDLPPSTTRADSGKITIRPIRPQYRVRLIGYRDWLESCGLAFVDLGPKAEGLISLGQRFCSIADGKGPPHLVWAGFHGVLIHNDFRILAERKRDDRLKLETACVYLGVLVDNRHTNTKKAQSLISTLKAKENLLPSWCSGDIILAEGELAFLAGEYKKAQSIFKELLNKYRVEKTAIHEQGKISYGIRDSELASNFRMFAGYRIGWSQYLSGGDPSEASRWLSVPMMYNTIYLSEAAVIIREENELFIDIGVNSKRKND